MADFKKINFNALENVAFYVDQNFNSSWWGSPFRKFDPKNNYLTKQNLESVFDQAKRYHSRGEILIEFASLNNPDGFYEARENMNHDELVQKVTNLLGMDSQIYDTDWITEWLYETISFRDSNQTNAYEKIEDEISYLQAEYVDFDDITEYENAMNYFADLDDLSPKFMNKVIVPEPIRQKSNHQNNIGGNNKQPRKNTKKKFKLYHLNKALQVKICREPLGRCPATHGNFLTEQEAKIEQERLLTERAKKIAERGANKNSKQRANESK